MVVHTDETMPVKALTNNTYEESIDSWKKSRWWMFWKLLERRFWRSSPIRFEIAADRVKGFNENGKDKAVDYAFDTLEKTRDDAESNPTQWSIVFDTKNLKIHFHTRTNPEIRSISLTMLDFSCATPTQMLDIHQNLSGDISNNFMDYSHEVNLNHFLRFIEKWGLSNVSPEEIKALTEHLAQLPHSRVKIEAFFNSGLTETLYLSDFFFWFFKKRQNSD